MKNIFRRITKNWVEEKGQIFVIVLILTLMGALIVTPLLTYMGTGLNTGKVYEQKTSRLNAADAGINDGIWQIKYDHLETTCPTYMPYDFNTAWNYTLPEPVNGHTVDVTVRNSWIPAGNPANPSDSLNSPPVAALANRIIT
jgi:hypothetical protein